MNSRLLVVGAAAAVLAVACAEDREAMPAPEFRRQTGLACDFNSVNRLAGRYFKQPTLNEVRDLLKLMQSAGSRTPGAVGYGYDVLAKVEVVVGDGTAGNPATGSDLVNQLILCMYDPSAGPDYFPASFPVNFTVSLDPGQAGGFGVRGPADAHATPIYARGGLPQSGIAPEDGSTWSAILNERVLIYGFPVSGTSYDWAMIRPGAAFLAPGAVVGLCLQQANLMVHESSVGLLPFADAYFLPLPCNGTAWAGFDAGLFRFAMSLFAPRPLFAASTLNPGGVGGLAGGLKSIFSTTELSFVDAAFASQPLDGVVNQAIPTSPTGGIVVQVSAAGAAFPSPTTVRLIAVDNNGAPEPGITCPDLLLVTGSDDCVATSGADGRAWFGYPQLNKTGAYRLETTGGVVDRTIGLSLARSDKFNVRP